MQGFKGVLVVTAVIAAVALGACRREVEHTADEARRGSSGRG